MPQKVHLLLSESPDRAWCFEIIERRRGSQPDESSARMAASPGRRKGTPTAVGDLIGQVLGDLGLDGVAKAHQIGARWEEIVGKQVAAHCRPLGLRGERARTRGRQPCLVTAAPASEARATRPPSSRPVWRDAPRELRFQVGYARRRLIGGSRCRHGRQGRHDAAQVARDDLGRSRASMRLLRGSGHAPCGVWLWIWQYDRLQKSPS